MTELLPCPFCGGKARISEEDEGYSYIECIDCGATTEDCTNPVEMWNKRKLDSNLDKIKDLIRELHTLIGQAKQPHKYPFKNKTYTKESPYGLIKKQYPYKYKSY